MNADKNQIKEKPLHPTFLIRVNLCNLWSKKSPLRDAPRRDFYCMPGAPVARLLKNKNEIVQGFKSVTPVGWHTNLPTDPQGFVGFLFYEKDCITH